VSLTSTAGNKSNGVKNIAFIQGVFNIFISRKQQLQYKSYTH